MQKQHDDCDIDLVLDQTLGYLNFSSGTADEGFLRNLNQIFRCLDARTAADATSVDASSESLVHTVAKALIARLEYLRESNSAFSDVQQATRVIDLVVQHVLPAYLAHHQDLLFHRTPETTFNSFFVGRVCEAVLASQPLEREVGEVVQAALDRLNDFVGHRPLPTLETRKIEPYRQEWVRPIPIYIRGVGVAHGRYEELISATLKVLRETPVDLLEAAHFDVDRLQELAIDPRTYDFDHPINRRPNFHFGQWDENSVSQSGFYQRFIVHEVTLDSVMARLNETGEHPTSTSKQELIFEEASVMAGTILMASGVSGWGPGAFDSTISLSTLLPGIAKYRDAFYEHMLGQLTVDHRNKLIEEITERHQPFGAARQHLNNFLANIRSMQLIRNRLAINFARMGYPTAAHKQTQMSPVASTQILCQIEALLAKGRIELRQNSLQDACQTMPQIMQRLLRGIECGAIVDPWNILGFDAHYSLFPAIENSIRDHRIDDLLDLIESIVNFCSQIWIAAAAESNHSVCEDIRSQFEGLAIWFHKFAAHEVEAVDSIDPLEVFDATQNVANAIHLWQENLGHSDSLGGISFWSQHAELFQSPRAFALTIDAMIERLDFQTSMGLLIYWLSQSARIPLEYGDTSFCSLANKWLHKQAEQQSDKPDVHALIQIWERLQKFYDYLEANADHYWEIPQFELNSNPERKLHEDQPDADASEYNDVEDDLYGAAYENVVYIDTTGDGVEGSLDEGGTDSDVSEAWRIEAERVTEHLMFLEVSADLFKLVSTLVPLSMLNQMAPADYIKLVKRQLARSAEWEARSARVSSQLDEVTDRVERYRLNIQGTDHFSMMDYDRQRHYKESLIEQLISVNVEFKNARQLLSAWALALNSELVGAQETRTADPPQPVDNLEPEQSKDIKSQPNQVADDEAESSDQSITRLFAEILSLNRSHIVDATDQLLESMNSQHILYVPLSKGGKCRDICEIRTRQCALGELLDCLPRIGMFQQAFEMTQLILAMERNQKTRPGAVTEFDELFRVSFCAMIESLIESAEQLKKHFQDQEHLATKVAAERSETALFESIEMLTESMLLIWLSHSRTLRLSVLEKIEDTPNWDRLKDFIQHYGANLFTQMFLNPTNIRSILHQGVDTWLNQILNESAADELPLIRDLGTILPRKLAVKYITLILEAVYENYAEYRDYNSTTTQSDQGEMIYVLLDFLRLRGKYERVCWHLKPVIWAHETLVRNRQLNVARKWRRALAERVGTESKRFIDECDGLRKKYSIQMGSIYDRINERFVHPMQVDRLCSFVEQAMKAPNSPASQRIFDLIEHLASSLAENSNGPGIDEPNWIVALSEEVEKVELKLHNGVQEARPLIKIPPLPFADLRQQLESLPRRHG